MLNRKLGIILFLMSLSVNSYAENLFPKYTELFLCMWDLGLYENVSMEKSPTSFERDDQSPEAEMARQYGYKHYPGVGGWHHNGTTYLFTDRTMHRLEMDRFKSSSFQRIKDQCGLERGEHTYFMVETMVLTGGSYIKVPVFLRRKSIIRDNAVSFDYDDQVSQYAAPKPEEFPGKCTAQANSVWGGTKEEIQFEIQAAVLNTLLEAPKEALTYEAEMREFMSGKHRPQLDRISERSGKPISELRQGLTAKIKERIASPLKRCKATENEMVVRQVNRALDAIELQGRAGVFRSGEGGIYGNPQFGIRQAVESGQ
ncbi:MAG: hypothetical protein AAF203_03440 [Pseudomonadota bacterium]